MEQITKIDGDNIKISTPQPNFEEIFPIDEIIRKRDAAQALVDKYNTILGQAKTLGIDTSKADLVAIAPVNI